MEPRVFEEEGYHFLTTTDEVTCLEFEQLAARRAPNSGWHIFNGDTLLFDTPVGVPYSPEEIITVLCGQISSQIGLPYYPEEPKITHRRSRTMKYIAYGSNMNVEQMAFRCPDAKLLGVGRIKGYALEFYLHATVERTANLNDSVPVAVWEISPDDEANLDFYEGYPKYYGKKMETVYMPDGSKIRGMVYLMNLIRPQPPTMSYYKGIEAAYRKLGLHRHIGTTLLPALKASLRRAGYAC